MDIHDEDSSVLEQGSHFDERVFLSRKPERTLVRQLLTEEIQTDDFVDSDILQSYNGRLLITPCQQTSGKLAGWIPRSIQEVLYNDNSGILKQIVQHSDYLKDMLNIFNK